MKLHDDECHKYLCHLAMGPLRCVKMWPIYFVNGYKFHTEERNEGKKTYNCGVCVKGVGESDVEKYYYGILKEVVEIEYPGESVKKCILFNCDWYDTTLNRDVRLHKYGGFAKIRRSGRYRKYDPFIFADAAAQVYYMPYPQKTMDIVDWLVVVPTKPRARVDNQYTLEVSYQEDNMSSINVGANDAAIDTLRDDSDIYEEANLEDEVEEEEVEQEEEFDDGISYGEEENEYHFIESEEDDDDE